MNEHMYSLLRQIPKVDELLSNGILTGLRPLAFLTRAVRQVLTDLRYDIQESRVELIPCVNELAHSVKQLFDEYTSPNLKRVINGTGIILHTNLGRAPLAVEALSAVTKAAWDYSNLEYCLEKGERSSRHIHVEDLLTQLTGCDAAMVVNNNAAAVLLALAAVACGETKEVIVSRGELVEIGGSFRVPDVLTQSGCKLVEVGTTNKTHLKDYEKAIDPARTGALLRVHTSNFTITGFTYKPSLNELSHIAKKHGIPLIEDLGSGCMIPLSQYGIDQPVVADSVRAGVDIITFSGDKLLGGPQAGIIIGLREHIAKMKAHPLARAMRIDKLCLAALEATLRLYLDAAVEKIPTLRMLCEPVDKLHEKAQMLEGLLKKCNFCGDINIIMETSQAGGGAMPGENLATAAVAISSDKISANELEQHFGGGPVPIIGRISHNRFILDVRTINLDDFPLIAARLEAVFNFDNAEFSRQIFANRGGRDAAYVERTQGAANEEWRKFDRKGGVGGVEYSFLKDVTL